MLTLLSAVVFAAMPPDVHLEDLERWEPYAELLLDGPPGCWSYVGKATWDWDIGRFGGSRGDAAFAGRLDQGEWGEIVLKPLGEVLRTRKEAELRVYAEEARFAPMVGKLKGATLTVSSDKAEVEANLADGAESTNVLRSVLDELSGEAITSWASWDDTRAGVVLHRVVPIGDGRRAPEAEVSVFFPGGGQLPTSLDVVFPESFAQGLMPRWRITGAVVHVRGQVAGDKVFPSEESFSFEFSVLGFHFTGAQTISYRHVTRCAEATSATME